MQTAISTTPSSTEDHSLRLLLVRSRPGELPWLATTIAKTMAPVEIVEVIGFANAIWRLGNEPFDSVLLDVELRDPVALAYCREQIAEIGGVPVLNLREQVGIDEPAPVQAERATPDARENGSPPDTPEGAPRGTPEVKGGRRGLRVPWQRRPRRQPQPAGEPDAVPAG